MRLLKMVQWQTRQRGAHGDQLGEHIPHLPSTTVKEEQQDDEEAVTTGSLESSESCLKRSRPLSQLLKPRSSGRTKRQPACYNAQFKQIKREDTGICKRQSPVSSRKDNSVDRWSMERYKMAEKNMLEVMKAEGAAMDKPISRPVLRSAARKFIGDTGLLDHLLKHIDGKVAPGGMERFRRCYNTEGTMEYWLESADLVDIKRASEMPEPNWVPPSWSKSCGATIGDSASNEELALLKNEMAKMKRDMEELMANNTEKARANQVEEIHTELMKWRFCTDQRLMEISNSLNGMQGMYRELLTWKFKAEQQLVEISNSVNSLRSVASKHCSTFSPSRERWEDWLTNAEDFTWLDSTEPLIGGQDVSVRDAFATPESWLKPSDSFSQDIVCTRELEAIKEEIAKMKRDVQELLPRRSDDEQTKLTLDSSDTVNSKSDHSDSLFQEMLMDLMKWKAKMEQQMLEISSRVSSLQTSKHRTT